MRRLYRRLMWRIRSRLQRTRFEDEDWDPLEFNPAVLTTVKVEDIPVPHYLFRCRYADRSKDLFNRLHDEPQLAGQQFLASLTAEEIARCPYHQADWKRVAAISVAVLARLQRGQNLPKALARLGNRYLPTQEDKLALHALFADPIRWGFDAPELTNGQHRVCALKKADADLCVVER